MICKFCIEFNDVIAARSFLLFIYLFILFLVCLIFGFIPTARITYVRLCCKVAAIVNLKSCK